MKTYNLELSEKDFEQMAKELQTISEKLSKAEDLILNALADYTLERVVHYIAITVGQTDYEGTDNLINSIKKSDIFNHTIKVYTDVAYAKYVEYGTGIRGASNSHPDAEVDGWTYNYRQETTGQVAHKFMYSAFQDLRQNYMQIAKDVLRKEGII